MSDELKFGTQSSLQNAWTPLQKEWQTFELISDIRFNSTDYCDVIGDYSHPCHGQLHRTILLHWSAGTSWKRRDKRPLSTEPKTLQQDVNMSWHVLTQPGCSFPMLPRHCTTTWLKVTLSQKPTESNSKPLQSAFGAFARTSTCDLGAKVPRFLPGVQKTDCQTCGIRTCLFGI